jgi:hypothetical protein
MYKFEIKVPIYNCTCKIIIDNDIVKTINNYGKRNKWDKHDYNVHGLAVNPGDMQEYYIFYAIDSLNVNTIVHEITHLVDYILEDRAIENEGEAKAYLTGYISEKVFDYILRRNLLINKWYKPIDNQRFSDEKPSRLLREGDKAHERAEERSSGCGDQQALCSGD